ncbi:proton-coupled zinc antiporter SLC30A9, mitochondrial-like [Liolophura sinensis]|uniref:proton-coupled zinc antiporter SLC30A9, mitochondrial-like n=1 Tax=Liolophura sinensis TaxID=3198878 RepID=UPI00315887A1
MWKQAVRRELYPLVETQLKSLLQQTGQSKYTRLIYCKVCQRPYSARLSVPKKMIPGIPYSKQFKLSRSFLAKELCCRTVSTDQGGAKDENHSDKKTAGTKTAEDDTSGSTDQSPKVVKVTAKIRKKIDYNYSGNIFITPVRAMNEYLLSADDLDSLPKYMRRSPYEHKAPLTMYMRSDVEKRAMEIWGDAERLAREKTRRFYRDSLSGKVSVPSLSPEDILRLKIPEELKSRLTITGDEKPYIHGEDKVAQSKEPSFWETGSARVVMYAICVNGVNTVLKLVAWLYTGSSSMFSEFIHSVADTVNQIILGFGLYHSIKKPDAEHPYGYTNLRYISSLISGVGIFCFGTGLSCYHGIQGFLHPGELGSLIWAIAILMGSLASEGASLIVAINQVRKSAAEKKMKFWEYVWRGYDPNVNVVLLEDLAAVMGVTVAASCMTVTHMTGNPFADSLGSLLIGGLLGGVASFIIYTNTTALVGRSIPLVWKNNISQQLERDRMIRSLHDVKATEMGGQVRFKAEIDFDGREITRAYLYKLDLEQLLAEMQALKKTDDAELFMLAHGEKIIDMLGEEVDRIEKIMKEQYPELRHVDLEAL